MNKLLFSALTANQQEIIKAMRPYGPWRGGFDRRSMKGLEKRGWVERRGAFWVNPEYRLTDNGRMAYEMWKNSPDNAPVLHAPTTNEVAEFELIPAGEVQYQCQQCGAIHIGFVDHCPSCNTLNVLVVFTGPPLELRGKSPADFVPETISDNSGPDIEAEAQPKCFHLKLLYDLPNHRGEVLCASCGQVFVPKEQVREAVMAKVVDFDACAKELFETQAQLAKVRGLIEEKSDAQ